MLSSFDDILKAEQAFVLQSTKKHETLFAEDYKLFSHVTDKIIKIYKKLNHKYGKIPEYMCKIRDTATNSIVTYRYEIINELMCQN